MNARYSWAALSAVLVLGPVQASAAVVTHTIDEFNAEQYVSDEPSAGLSNNSQVVAPTAIGGFRDLEVSTGSSSLNTTNARVEDGILRFSNDALVRGEGWATWDGDDDPLTVNTTGLGGIDLVQGPSPRFAFDVITADHTLEFTFNVWDMAGGFSSYFEVLPPLEQLETDLFFSQFTGNADFNNVGALQIYVNAPEGSQALDAAISSIRVEVIPLPASALLLLGGLGAFAGLRSRRRAA